MLDTGDLGQFLVLASMAGLQAGGGGGGGVTYPIALNKGGTNAVLAPSANSLVVGTSSGMGFLATANSGVLVTDGTGIPSVSTTLPSGLTIPGFLPIPTSLGLNRLVVGNSNTTMIGLVTPNSAVLGSSATGVPMWSSSLPVGITVPGYSRTTTYAGNPNGNVAGNAGDFVIDTTDGNELWYCATSGTATTATWTLSAGGSGSGVTSITAGTGLSGGTITTTGTIALAPIATNTILANATTGTAAPTPVAIGNLLTFTGGVLNAVNQLANPVPLAAGGTGTAVTSAPPGGIYFVNSAGMGTLVLAPTTPGWALVSGQNGGTGTSSAPSWTNYALPTTVTANSILFASTNAVVGQITPVNSAVLQTNASGVPSLQTTLPNGFVTYAAIQNVTAAKLLGNPTGAAAAPSEITIGSGLTLTGSTLSATGAGVAFPITLAQGGTNTDLSTATANSLIYTTGSGGVATVPFGSSQGTFLQISTGATGFQYSSYSLPQTISSGNVGGVVYASSTGALVVSAGGVSNGFVVTNAGGNPTIVSALPANSVGLSSLAQIANATLLGNASGATGNVSTISIAGALTLTGGVLTNTSPSATGAGASGTWPISITGSAASASTASTATVANSVATNGVSTAAIQAAAVTYAKIQNVAASRLLGNPTASPAAPSEISVGTGLTLSTSGILSATSAGGTGVSVFTGTGTPVGNVTSNLAGDMYVDTTLQQTWFSSVGNSNSNWLTNPFPLVQAPVNAGSIYVTTSNSFVGTEVAMATGVLIGKVGNVAPSYLKANSSVLGSDASGNPQWLTVGSGLTLSGTTLSASATTSAAPILTVSAATTVSLTGTSTFVNNGGVGDTITFTATGVQTFDTVAFTSTTQSLLVKNNSGISNGVFNVTTPGGTGVNCVLTRSPLYDTTAKQLNYAYVVPIGGTQAQIPFINNNSTLPIGSSIYTFTPLARGASTTVPTTGSIPYYTTLGELNTVNGTGLLIATSGSAPLLSANIPPYPFSVLATGTGMTLPLNYWINVTGTTQQTFTLPTGVTNTYIKIFSATNTFKIAQIAGSSIQFNTNITTVGTGGSLTANSTGCSLTIFCYSGNLWVVVDSVGNFTGV